MKRDALTGLMVDVTPGDVVTDEQVKAVLADFP